jgi:energy-converting hydrogenase Eha subunit A
MKPTSNDKLLAYLTLFSGLSISAVAIYYSVMGLVAIYPAMIIPIVIMGIVIELGKLSATVWLKQSWTWAPIFIKAYILPAIAMLMFITSIGVFGFLSKAHSDQSLVSGDVGAKIAVYDEKIKTEKDNVDANRKQLKQMDEAVDQVMARSTSEGGADKAVAIRRSQQKERARILADITESQKRISSLNEERAPIAAEVRKVEAEVGPIKYIAALMYGDNPDANVLEKAVTWVTILIVIVLDPLAVVLLLASQYSFQRIREYENKDEEPKNFKIDFEGIRDPKTGQWIQTGPAFEYEADNSPLTQEQWDQLNSKLKDVAEKKDPDYYVIEDADEEDPELAWNRMISEAEAEIAKEKEKEKPIDPYAYLNTTTSFYKKPEGWVSLPPMVAEQPLEEAEVEEPTIDEFFDNARQVAKAIDEGTYEPPVKYFDWTNIPEDQEYIMLDGQNMHVRAAKAIYKQTPPVESVGYVQNEEQTEESKWNHIISESEYRDQALAKQNDRENNTNNPA